MDYHVEMVGDSPGITRVEEDIFHASRTDARVLITGESGVGKNLVAQLIHRRGTRRHVSLMTLGCAGLADQGLELELFGPSNIDSSPSVRSKQGWLEMAQAGTIFIDEIGEMSLAMQARLFQFLATGEVGAHRHTVDVRLITAAGPKLFERVADGSFHDDLFYRLNTIHIEVPPLRERAEDIPALLEHFLQVVARRHRVPPPSIERESVKRLQAYDWPGNVRELRNFAERIVLQLKGHALTDDLLSDKFLADSLVPRRLADVQSTARRRCESLFEILLAGKDSFWTAVYDPFKAHDLTRDDVRELIRRGLEYTRGNYTLLVRSFNMPPEDYKPFLNFLRKYQCHVPYQGFRTAPAAFVRQGAARIRNSAG